MYVYTYVHIYICIYINIYMCVCMHIYIYIHKTAIHKLKDTLIQWNERNIQEFFTTPAVFGGIHAYIYIYIHEFDD